jgi:ABC-type nickel/cobalt efflux system permease component RcnA
MIARTQWRFVFAAVLTLAALIAAHNSAFAGSPLGISTPDSRGVAFGGPFGGFFVWVAMQQTAFYKLLTGSLEQLKSNSHAFWLLGGVSFLYGVFHAAGPGHGKAVITSYLLVSRETMRRGILIAFASALLQGMMAITIVLLMAVIFKATAIGMTRATDWLEIMSYAFVTAVGAWLLWTKATGRGHAHSHGCTCGHSAHTHDHHNHQHGQEHTGEHEHDSDHGHDHSHAPDPQLLAGRLTLSRAWSAILAVGIRPCSGAIIILVFALSQHLLSAGIASVLAMSLGTAITVSSLVVLAVSAKDLALRFAGTGSRSAERVLQALEVIAALFVLLFGLTLLGGAVAAGLPIFAR